MHDPDVVAFEIRRPWPRRDSFVRQDAPRWKVTMHSPFWRLAGHGYYFPSLVVVWHREPGGRDSGEVCKHYVRRRGPDGKWEGRILRGWRFHVHHWHIQVPPLQALRRSLLTRCAWCGGRDRRGERVNTAAGWHTPDSPWWRGERELFHSECLSVRSAHRLCLCAEPLLDHDGYGTCALCGKSRSWRKVPDDADRILAALPVGSRITPDARPLVERAWAERRANR